MHFSNTLVDTDKKETRFCSLPPAAEGDGGR